MKKPFCDHCKKLIERDTDYFYCEITLLHYNIVSDSMGYSLATEINHKGETNICLCKDCGEKMLCGCRW